MLTYLSNNEQFIIKSYDGGELAINNYSSYNDGSYVGVWFKDKTIPAGAYIQTVNSQQDTYTFNPVDGGLLHLKVDNDWQENSYNPISSYIAYTTIIDNENVVAIALNDLNYRLELLEQGGGGQTLVPATPTQYGYVTTTDQSFGGTKTFVDDIYANLLSSSDINLKTNIKHISYIDDINICEFDFKDNEQHSIGVIAQELQENYPEFVHEDPNTNMLHVDYNAVIMKLLVNINSRLEKLERTYL